MYSTPLATFVTTTSVGSWLPGDVRGYVNERQHLPSQPALALHAQNLLKKSSVVFSAIEQRELFAAIQLASQEFGYRLTDAVVEAMHLHWIIGHDDAVEAMVGRLKTRMRQRLNRGRIWTEGYSHRLLFDDDSLYQARNYLTKHDGLRLLNGQLINTA
jgi:hypothetical protein